MKQLKQTDRCCSWNCNVETAAERPYHPLTTLTEMTADNFMVVASSTSAKTSKASPPNWACSCMTSFSPETQNTVNGVMTQKQRSDRDMQHAWAFYLSRSSVEVSHCRNLWKKQLSSTSSRERSDSFKLQDEAGMLTTSITSFESSTSSWLSQIFWKTFLCVCVRACKRACVWKHLIWF